MAKGKKTNRKVTLRRPWKFALKAIQPKNTRQAKRKG